MGNEFTNKILKLALPITAQQFMLALVSACDAFMLGGLNRTLCQQFRWLRRSPLFSI